MKRPAFEDTTALEKRLVDARQAAKQAADLVSDLECRLAETRKGVRGVLRDMCTIVDNPRGHRDKRFYLPATLDNTDANDGATFFGALGLDEEAWRAGDYSLDCAIADTLMPYFTVGELHTTINIGGQKEGYKGRETCMAEVSHCDDVDLCGMTWLGSKTYSMMERFTGVESFTPWYDCDYGEWDDDWVSGDKEIRLRYLVFKGNE